MYSDKVIWKNFMKNIKFLCTMYICNGNGSLLEDSVGRFLILKLYFQKFTVNPFHTIGTIRKHKDTSGFLMFSGV